ncbi:hypothetical protein Yalta_019 [Yalta virus]|nr:hypothetical protein Yalta_019 [Yalta virus]
MSESNPETVGIKNETIYSQTIDYIYPDGQVSERNVKSFFRKNDKSADPNIMQAMEFVYNTPLTLDGLKKIDMSIEFETEKIKEYIIANYKNGNNITNNKAIYQTMRDIDPLIKEEYINDFISDLQLTNIRDFANYIIGIIPK